EVGVIVDTSHSGRQTTLDACQASSAPVVATHTSAAALYRCDRAKSDEELRALAATGGVIGIVCVPFFLAAPDSPGQTIELVLDHVDYVSQLVGVEHVGIGTDWPIALPHALQRRMFVPFLAEIGFREEHGVDVVAALDGFRDYRDLVNITRGLVSRGYSDGEIAGILGENFLRVFEQVVGGPPRSRSRSSARGPWGWRLRTSSYGAARRWSSSRRATTRGSSARTGTPASSRRATASRSPRPA